MPQIENTWKEPIGNIIKDAKDIFIEELQNIFNENHPRFPNLFVGEKYPDELVNWKGVVLSRGSLTIKKAGIGQEVWWRQYINDELVYRSDVQLFDGSIDIKVAARGSIPRDEIADAVMQALMLPGFNYNVQAKGVEYNVVHTWSGDSEQGFEEKSSDFLFTTSTTINISGEMYFTRSETTGVIEEIIIIPSVARDEDTPVNTTEPSSSCVEAFNAQGYSEEYHI